LSLGDDDLHFIGLCGFSNLLFFIRRRAARFSQMTLRTCYRKWPNRQRSRRRRCFWSIR